MEIKKCLYCGEKIPAEARKCPHCKEWLEMNAPHSSMDKQQKKRFSEQLPDDYRYQEEVADRKGGAFVNAFWKQITHHFFDFSGVIGREEFWHYMLFYIAFLSTFYSIEFLYSTFFYQIEIPFPISWVTHAFQIALLIPSWSIASRRLNSIGKNRFLILLSFVPLANLWLIYLFCKKETTPVQAAVKWKGLDTIISILIAFSAFILFVIVACYAYWIESNRTYNNGKWSSEEKVQPASVERGISGKRIEDNASIYRMKG
ncbi:MAG: DUF805 domain-containing protein [Phocaeicola sp.]